MRKYMTIIGIAVSLFCLYLVFRGLSIHQILMALRTANLRWIALALSLYSFAYWFRAVRWKILLASIKSIPPIDLLGPLIIGFFANNVLPFRMGEIIRAHVTGRKFHISRTASLGTIVVERIFDTLAFLSSFLVVTFFFPFPAGVKHGAYALAGGCLAAIAILYLAIHYQQFAHRVIETLPMPQRLKSQVRHLLTNFTHGVSGITQGSYVFPALGYSIVIWTIEGTVLYLIARAFPIGLTYPQAFFVLFFVGLSVTLPQAPGYVGTIELFGVTALSVLGIPRDQGLPVILALHGSQFLFICALGLGALWKEGLSVRSIVSSDIRGKD